MSSLPRRQQAAPGALALYRAAGLLVIRDCPRDRRVLDDLAEIASWFGTSTPLRFPSREQIGRRLRKLNSSAEPAALGRNALQQSPLHFRRRESELFRPRDDTLVTAFGQTGQDQLQHRS
jgi:hypothetical protein